MNIEEKTIDSELVYDCPVFKVFEDISLLPNGQQARRNWVRHNGGSGVLPIDKDGNVILVEQYRYGISKTTLEIPAGKLEPNEDPVDCALRELSEEVGGKTNQLISLGCLAATPAYDSEIIYIFMAKCDRFEQQCLDKNEFLQIHHMPFEDALKLVMNGTITDSKTQIALLKANEMRKG